MKELKDSEGGEKQPDEVAGAKVWHGVISMETLERKRGHLTNKGYCIFWIKGIEKPIIIKEETGLTFLNLLEHVRPEENIWPLLLAIGNRDEVY